KNLVSASPAEVLRIVAIVYLDIRAIMHLAAASRAMHTHFSRPLRAAWFRPAPTSSLTSPPHFSPQSLCDANANGYDTREEVWDSNNPVRVPPNVEIPLWAVEAVFGQSVAIGITNDYKVPAFRGYVHDGIRLKASHSLYSRLLLQIESPSAVYFEVVCSKSSRIR
ncbi:hypothetical protein HDU83_002014, partial [Entophlyctis luteolus]